MNSSSNICQMEIDCKNWKTGDILLHNSGEYPQTQCITNSQWTHVGLIYIDTEKNNEVQCIHMIPEGMKCTEITEHANQYMTDKFHYFGHRSLNKKLNEQQLQDFMETLGQLTFTSGRPRGYSNFTSMANAAIDCCDCWNSCCNKVLCCKGCRKETECEKQERLERLFCSEFAAEMLKACDVMEGLDDSDE